MVVNELSVFLVHVAVFVRLQLKLIESPLSSPKLKPKMNLCPGDKFKIIDGNSKLNSAIYPTTVVSSLPTIYLVDLLFDVNTRVLLIKNAN